MTWHTFPAPAKLNLFLHVVGRRPDGYHLLQTAFTFIDLADEIRLRVRHDGRIQLHTPLPGVPSSHDLTVRAAQALQQASNCALGVDIAYTKHIPQGGGLGGGSSNAATVLMALNQLWATGLSRASLQALALPLGADVPLFVFGKSSFAEGVGEILQEIELPPHAFLLIAPQVSVPTPEIFADSGLTRNTKPVKIAPFKRMASESGSLLASAEALFLTAQWRNDLAAVAMRLYPEVAHALMWLKDHSAGQIGEPRMSGSGACVFAAYENKAAAIQAQQALPQDLPSWVVMSYNAHPLCGLVD